MAYKEDEKTLSADINISLADAFEKQWKARGQIQKRAVAGALRLWISLPQDLQAKLISRELGENDFISLVRQIVDERIQVSREVPSKSIDKKLPKKSGQKGQNPKTNASIARRLVRLTDADSHTR